MAQKLSVQIALEGGKEIERQLADIGDAGKKAFTEIAKAAETTGGFRNMKPDEVTEALKVMGVTGVDEINKIQAAVKSAGRLEGLVQGIAATEKAVSRLTNSWKIFTRVLAPLGAISAAVTGLGNLATAAENTIVALGTLAARAGTSIAKIDAQRQTFMAAGGQATEFSKIYETLVGNIDKLKADKLNELTEAMKKMKEAGWGDEALNRWAEQQRAKIDAWAPAGKTASEQFAELGKRLAALSTDQQRLALLQREGVNATLQNANALMKMSQMADQARDSSKDLTQAELDRALAQQKATTELSNAWTRLTETIGRLAMGTALTNFITGFVNNFTKGLELIDMAFQELPAVVGVAFNSILSVAQPVITQITTMWQIFVVGFQSGLILLQTGWNMIWAALSSVATPVLNTVKAAWDILTNAISTGLTMLQSGWNTVWSTLAGVATSVLDAITAAWNGFTSAIASTVATISSAFDSVMSVISQVTAAINNAWQALKNLLGAGQAVGGTAMAAGGLAGHAGGGLLRGRGTGTSDSNLAWVSRGEHIMPARAVRQPGVLAFLEALRRSGGNLSRVLDGMGRFALGGMVPRSILAFAGGGVVGRMSNVTIQFPGLPEIGGLRAPSAVVDELRRAAAMAQVRSGGRKPSRYS